MIHNTFNTAVTETANEILGKHRQNKTHGSLQKFLIDETEGENSGEKRFEHEGSEKYREVNNNIKRGMKKAKENWIEEQCTETEENLKKNNSKRA